MTDMSECRVKQRLTTQVKAVEETDKIRAQRCQASFLLWGNESLVATKEGEVGKGESLWTEDNLLGRGSPKTTEPESLPACSRTSQVERRVKPVSSSSMCTNALGSLGKCWKDHFTQRNLGRRWAAKGAHLPDCPHQELCNQRVCLRMGMWWVAKFCFQSRAGRYRDRGGKGKGENKQVFSLLPFLAVAHPVWALLLGSSWITHTTHCPPMVSIVELLEPRNMLPYKRKGIL